MDNLEYMLDRYAHQTEDSPYNVEVEPVKNYLQNLLPHAGTRKRFMHYYSYTPEVTRYFNKYTDTNIPLSFDLPPTIFENITFACFRKSKEESVIDYLNTLDIDYEIIPCEFGSKTYISFSIFHNDLSRKLYCEVADGRVYYYRPSEYYLRVN